LTAPGEAVDLDPVAEAEGPAGDPLRVGWAGPMPEWLGRNGGPVPVPVSELGTGGPPDVLHVTPDELDAIPRLRAAWPGAGLVVETGDDLRRGEARQLAGADLVLAQSLFALRELRRRHPRLAARSGLVRRPVDVERFLPEEVLAERRRRDLSLFRRFHRLAGPVVLYAGPYGAEGGLDLVIEAVLRVRSVEPELRLAAIPEGRIDAAYLDRCERLALALGHHGIIEWSVEERDAPLWYGVAAIVCSPAREPGSAEPMLRAAAAGTPFVGSELDPALEIVIDGETGSLLQPEDIDGLTDVLVALLDDDDERARLGRAARAKAASEHSPATALHHLGRFWREVAERRVGPSA